MSAILSQATQAHVKRVEFKSCNLSLGRLWLTTTINFTKIAFSFLWYRKEGSLTQWFPFYAACKDTSKRIWIFLKPHILFNEASFCWHEASESVYQTASFWNRSHELYKARSKLANPANRFAASKLLGFM